MTEQPDDTDCIDSNGNDYPEHDYRGHECRRCGAEAADEA